MTLAVCRGIKVIGSTFSETLRKMAQEVDKISNFNPDIKSMKVEKDWEGFHISLINLEGFVPDEVMTRYDKGEKVKIIVEEVDTDHER